MKSLWRLSKFSQRLEDWYGDLNEISGRLRAWSDTLDAQCAFLNSQLPTVSDVNGTSLSDLMKHENGLWMPFKEARMPLFLDDEGNYQQDTYLAALEHTRNRRSAIDVGANIGTHARLMAKDFERVHAFEPNHLCRACLARNVAAGNCIIYPFAVSDRSGEQEDLHFPEIAQGGGTVEPTDEERDTWPARYGLTTCTVATIALDDLHLAATDLVKIDIQGHETAAIRGMQRILQQQRPVVVVETGGNRGANDEPVTLLEEMGYSVAERIGVDAILVPSKQA